MKLLEVAFNDVAVTYIDEFNCSTKEVIEIIELQKKLREIEAIENYFEKYLLFELKTITQQKKGKIQQKIKKILDTSTSRCIRKIQLYSRILKKLKGTRELLKHLKKDNGACIEGVVDI
jgi:hypothetical protein